MAYDALTYDAADVHDALQLLDPTYVDIRDIVSAVKQAGAGTDGAGRMALAYCAQMGLRLFQDANYYLQDLGDAWDSGANCDLRELMDKQIQRIKESIFEMDLSDVHSILRKKFTRDRQALIAAMEAWRDKTGTDCQERLAKDRPWPRRIVYPSRNGAKNAELFLSVRPGRVLSWEGVLFAFEEGRYRALGDNEMEREIRLTDPGNTLDVEHVSKMVKGIHHRTAVSARPFEWLGMPKCDPKMIAIFRNGLLDLDTGQRHQHDGEFFATGLPEHDFDPMAECPLWERFLSEQLDPSYHATLQEWFGYCLTGLTHTHMMMVLQGVPRSGKSTILNVLIRLVGNELTHSGMLSDFGRDFGLQPCVGKRLFVVPDAHDVTGSGGLRGKALERIKAITGEDAVAIDRKHISAISAKLPMKIAIATNRLPSFIDESGALSRRLLLVDFSKIVPQEKIDPLLAEKLGAELPGIANWALTGLHRLCNNNWKFTVGEKGRDARDHAARTQSPAAQFAEDCLEISGNDDDFVPIREVYRTYESWTSDQGILGYARRSQSQLADDLVAAGLDVGRAQRRIDGKQTHGLKGVRSVVPPASFDFD